MQLASTWSFYCNIQHLTQQQTQLKIQWQMLRNVLYATSHMQLQEIDYAIHMMMLSSESWHKWHQGKHGPHIGGIAQCIIQKDAIQGKKMRNELFEQ